MFDDFFASFREFIQVLILHVRRPFDINILSVNSGGAVWFAGSILVSMSFGMLAVWLNMFLTRSAPYSNCGS
jgi:hypothetical protein